MGAFMLEKQFDVSFEISILNDYKYKVTYDINSPSAGTCYHERKILVFCKRLDYVKVECGKINGNTQRPGCEIDEYRDHK